MRRHRLSIGLEFSTQSAKLVVLDIDGGTVLYTGKFDYDTAFPSYETVGGVLPSRKPGTRHTSPFMLIEALDYAFAVLKKDGIDLSRISAIKTDGMQHCTVCAGPAFRKVIAALNPEKTLLEQIARTISRKTAPIWEDSSTAKQAGMLTALLSGKGGISAFTANKAELRFPAAQIMKWAAEHPEEYGDTAYIFLLSAFMTSLLAGNISPVDTGDGWGTNLNTADIRHPGWNPAVLAAIDSRLQRQGVKGRISSKLGKMAHYDHPVGRINRYFADKYGVNPGAIVLAGTGDNPATLLGCGGEAVISLGSSYTVNGRMADIMPSAAGEYNVFGFTKGTAMALSVITNGGKAHDYFKKKYLKSDSPAGWKKYAAMAGTRRLSDNERLMLPWLLDESVPRAKAGLVREGFSAADGPANIRALHISQALSLKIHSSHLGPAKKICVVGGGARNALLRGFISDVFGTPTYTINNPEVAAPLGCAISGAKAVLGASYSEACRIFVREDKDSYIFPDKANTREVRELLERYKQLEGQNV